MKTLSWKLCIATLAIVTTAVLAIAQDVQRKYASERAKELSDLVGWNRYVVNGYEPITSTPPAPMAGTVQKGEMKVLLDEPVKEAALLLRVDAFILVGSPATGYLSKKEVDQYVSISKNQIFFIPGEHEEPKPGNGPEITYTGKTGKTIRLVIQAIELTGEIRPDSGMAWVDVSL